MIVEEFLYEVRQNEKNRGLYLGIDTIASRGKSMKDISLHMIKDHINHIEEEHILKRYQSPSIVEALRLTYALNMVIFCCAVFFKYRAVNKRMQLYDEQLQNKVSDRLFLSFLFFSEIIQIAIGWLILRFFNGRRIKINFILIAICIPLEIA